MTEKDPQKLAAARRMLKEYQKKSRESSSTQSSIQLPNNSVIALKKDDTKSNDSSTQNYVYDSGTTQNSATQNSMESSLAELKHESIIKDNNNIFNNSNELNGVGGNDPFTQDNTFNGDTDLFGDSNESNDRYIARLVSELSDNQQSFPDNIRNGSTSSSISNTNISSQNITEVKPAKDFFNSLPLPSQSSIDFSFVTPSDIPLATPFTQNSISNINCTIETAPVPSSFVDAAILKTIASNSNDSQSDHSESVPFTPSEHDKSDDVSSSSVSQSPKHISKVLELQLKDIDTKLGIEINKNTILTEQLQQSHNHISQLKEWMETTVEGNNAKIAALEEKLLLHVKTLEILVSEKTALQTALTTSQESSSQKAGEIEELQGRLRASRHRVGDLERELALAQALRQQQEKTAHEATVSKDVLKKEVDLMRKHLDESTEEVLDLKYKLQEKCKEITSFHDDLKEKDSQLSLLQLRIDQLSVSDDGSGQEQNQDLVSSLHNDKKLLEKQVEVLNSNIKKLTSEKDEASSQYQQYVTSLNTQLQAMASKYETVSNQCENLTAREASLVDHIATLEKQMQQSLSRKHSPPPTTAVVSSLQQQNAELQQFKQQFESLSGEKKNLEEQLTLKVNETTDLNLALEEYTLKVKELERHIERLEADRPDAGLLQAAIESDKVAASRAISQNTDLKKQLQELQDGFIKLSNNKLELTEQLEVEQTHCRELTKQLAKLTEVNKVVDEEKPSKVEKIDFCSQTYNIKDAVTPEITIDLEAMAKLEDKFKRKMHEVADLSEEKQRLEHLVLQLQGETETIGEYIALYQIQRGMLRQKAQEKDEQMEKLSQEREVLRNKLNELNHLVTTLLPDSRNLQSGVAPVGNGVTNADIEHAQETPGKECDHKPVDVAPSFEYKRSNVNKEETAGKIRALLTEIGSSKLVTCDSETPNFHPCPVCSGRLITV